MFLLILQNRIKKGEGLFYSVFNREMLDGIRYGVHPWIDLTVINDY